MSTIVELQGGVGGGTILEVSGAERLVYDHLTVPFVPTKLYRVRARIQQTVRPSSGLGNLVRVGVEGLAANGRTLVGTDGSVTVDGQYFVAASNVDMGGFDLNAWVDCTGYIVGYGAYRASASDPAAPSGVHSDVAYLRPVVWVNIPDGDGTVRIDAVAVDIDADGLAMQLAATDPDILADKSYAGRVGYFDVGNSGTPTFGRILALSPMDGKMYPAGAYDAESNGFMAVDLGLGMGRQKLALPGTILRDDSLNLLPGREAYLDASGLNSGLWSQVEPALGQLRMVVGRALTPKTWLFSPHASVAMAVDVPYASRYIYCFSEPLYAVCEWNGYLYAGCGNAKIYRSQDMGLSWSLVYSGTGGANACVNAFQAAGSSLYAVIDKGTDTGCKCVRTTNGTSWNVAQIATEPYAYDLCLEASGGALLIACTGNPSGYGKIYTSTDGITWTLRYTSPTESVIIRLARYGTSRTFAFAGYGAAARTLYSLSGTTWSILNTYTGSLVPADMIVYREPVNNTLYSCCCLTDTGIIYGGTSSMSTAEKTDATIAWEAFIVLDGYLHCIGYKASPPTEGILYRRQVVSDGAGGWTISWVKVMDTSNITAWRHLIAGNGRTYYTSSAGNCLHRILRRNYLMT